MSADESLMRLVRAETAGEPVLWTGQSSPQRVLLSTLPIWLFGIPWTAFCVGWEAVAISVAVAQAGEGPRELGWMGPIFVLFGIPFVLVGLGMLGAPFWAARKARRTVWALTDRRLLKISEGRRGSDATSVDLPSVFTTTVKRRAGGSGSLTLGFGKARDSDGDLVERSMTVDHVDGIDALVRALEIARQRSAAAQSR